MILIFRKYIVRILLNLSFLFLLLLVALFIATKGSGFPTPWSEEQIWWSLFSNSTTAGMLKYISLGGQLIFSFLAGLIISRQIKRNPSAELSFFYLFLFCFSLQIFRIPFLLENPFPFLTASGLTTRIIYFSRILSLACLFAASLFSSGLQIQKFGMVLLISMLIAFTLASLIPVNTSIITGALINRIAREKHLALFCTTLEVLTVLNYIAAAQHQGRIEYYRLAFLSLLVITGYELLFFLHAPFMIPGFACLIPGTILFTRTSRKLFLWS
ncbi:hypothetical protein [Oceanispirochaeta sp.]|jgi:hypothetical protein|uniref:hypothetical protein n=1 Tax=Oceanispirochaeta sp. TaxID=2035350 RepID=UPI0026149BC1|nr:hypothetical protein [Oceanispirochaeta sp.]MDA3956448.1 hypothetical protein [Oceanispirochaeta sp.]